MELAWAGAKRINPTGRESEEKRKARTIWRPKEEEVDRQGMGEREVL